MSMIRYAQTADLAHIHDPHITSTMLERKLAAHEVIVIQHDDQIIGWLRFGYFWDSIPFMNLLWLDEPYRQQGFGTQLVVWWENAMREQGHEQVWTSTFSHETAQYFYRKRGYHDIGGFVLPNEPLELILIKELA